MWNHPQNTSRKVLNRLLKPTVYSTLLKSSKTRNQPEGNPDFLPLLLKGDNTGDFDPNGKPIEIDFSHEKFGGGAPILILNLMGGGKTVFVENMVSEMVKTGWKGCNISDFKSDFFYAREPLQPKYQHHLPPWRKADGLPVKNFIPKYVANTVYKKDSKGEMKDKPDEMEIGQIPLQSLTTDDLINSIFKIKTSEPQANLIRSIWRQEPKNIEDLAKAIKSDDQGLKEFVDADIITKINPETKASVVSRLTDIFMEGVVGDEFPMNFPQEMKEGNVPCLSFEGGSSTKMEYSQSIIASICRDIYKESRTGGKINSGKKFVVIDDATQIVPSRAEPSCKKVILHEFCELGRAFEIFPIVIAQNVSGVDKRIVEKARYVIAMAQLTNTDLKALHDIRGIDPETFESKFEDNFTSKPRRMDRGLYAGAREVIVWDMDKPDRPIKGWGILPSCALKD